MKKITFTALILAFVMQLSAQSTHEKIISIVPQYVFQNGFRVDYEYQLSENWKSWLQISPTLFISTDDNDITTYEYNSMNGIGLEVHHKYFMQEPDERKGFYFSYGGGIQMLGIKSDDLVTYEYTENGVEYISYRGDEIKTAINRLTLNIIVGKQVVRYKPFIIDYYLGVGFRYSVDRDFNLMETFNESWFDYGYSGSLIVAGIKLGFNISE